MPVDQGSKFEKFRTNPDQDLVHFRKPNRLWPGPGLRNWKILHRTRTDKNFKPRTGPEPSKIKRSRIDSKHDQNILRNPGPIWPRTQYILENRADFDRAGIKNFGKSWTGPGPIEILRCVPDEDQEKFLNLGPIRTVRSINFWARTHRASLTKKTNRVSL